MNRELKFRVWEVHNKKFSENPYGCCLNKNFELSVINDSFDGIIQEYVIQQFTGLKDKNNKDIFDGDILSFDTDAVRILWNDGCFCFIIEKEIYPLCKENIKIFKMKVLGNIFENSNLLK